MELAIPLVALGGLYIISNNQSPNNDENYREGMQDRLPSNTQEENNISVINKLNNDQVNDDLINQQDE